MSTNRRTGKDDEGGRKRRSSVTRMLLSVLGTFTTLALVALAATVFVLGQISERGPLRAEQRVLIPAGTGTREIAAMLEEKGIVHSSGLFLAALAVDRLRGVRGHLKAGEYAIPQGASIRDVISILRSGKALVHKVTIPEGFSVVQVLERLRRHPELTGEITIQPEEGSLLPDTYVFQRGETRDGIIRRMQEAQKRLLDELWPKRAPGLPFKTRREAVILASIVEKETGIPEERPRVAAVFINRLRKGIRLQSDPTIIYGITKGKPLGRPIRKSEIEAKTPWNTYRFKGLPPTPIANPGRDSIAAVLNPAKTDDLYFVADGTGGHVFAATLEEHNRNVRKWRKRLAVRAARLEKEVTGSIRTDGARGRMGADAGTEEGDAADRNAGRAAAGRVPLPRARPER